MVNRISSNVKKLATDDDLPAAIEEADHEDEER